ncbi:MAG: hypothetical protein AAB558_01210 [Patescibacteria group bacterium]
MKNKQHQGELVTKGYLNQELGVFKHEFDTFCSELRQKFKHYNKNFEFVFKKLMEHDERFDTMDDKLDKTINIIQGMADKVTKSYETFMAESASIHFNYNNLESRTTKLEEVVLPNK